MVTKITLFEPHVDGVQIGPASLGLRSSAEPTVSEPKPSRRSAVTGAIRSRSRPRVRSILVAGIATGTLLGAVLAWRRFRGHESETTDESEPMIEERSVEDLTA